MKLSIVGQLIGVTNKIHPDDIYAVMIDMHDNNKKIIQKAISHLKVLKSSDNYSYVELNPITGRKHQLRKQLYNIGNPIVGDDKYFINRKIDKKKTRSKNLMLHDYKIKFMINNIKYNFKAKYNKDFEEFLKRKF